MLTGCVIIMDLDKFEELSKSRGWSEYVPNIITGTLTTLVWQFVRKHFAMVIYGLDEKRGTEEVVLEIPDISEKDLEEIIEDLERIRMEISRLGASISIAVALGPVTGKPAKNRREAYNSYTRKRALKLLREVKRAGGNKVAVTH